MKETMNGDESWGPWIPQWSIYKTNFMIEKR